MVLIITGLLPACTPSSDRASDAAPDDPPDRDPAAAPAVRVDGPQALAAAPAWLRMRPDYRREESGRLSSEAIAECRARFPLDSLRARLDSLVDHHGLERRAARSHPETTAALDALLERQAAGQDCVVSSSKYRLSREIVEQAPTRFELPVYGEPDSTGERVGSIGISRLEEQAGPEQYAFTYRSAGAEAPTDWTLDRMPHGGYGDYYHTVLERRGGWLRLPADPFPTAVWIHWERTFRSPPEITPLFDGVYMMRPMEAEAAGVDTPDSWDAPGVVYLRADGDRLWFRLEGPEDGPCSDPRQSAAPDRGDSATEYWLPLRSVLDDRGHLVLGVKYGRGC